MSAKFLGWALDVMFKQSSLKNMLTITANLANHETHEVYGSLQYYQDATGLSKKTVIACLQQLEDMKILTRTGEMKGKTGQIPVYIFDIVEGIPTVPKGKGVKLHRLENDDVKEGRFCLETGSFLPRKEGQKRHTEPSTRNQEEKPDSPLSTKGPPSVEKEDLFGLESNLPAVIEPDVIRWIETEWMKLKEDHPGIAGIRKIDDGQAATIRQRAKQHAVDGEDAFAVWRAVFHEIRTSRFLLGYVPPKQGQDRPFKLSLNWLCAASKFRDVINGKFSSDTEERFAYRADGSPMGPGDQTAARAIERRLARRQQQRRG